MGLGSRAARLRGLLRTGTARTRLHPGVRVSIADHGSVTASGTFDLGTTWAGGRYYRGHLMVARGGRVVVEGDFQIHTGCQVWVNPGGTLTLGSGYVNTGLNLSCFHSITIGHGVMISEGVTIRDSDNHRLRGAGPHTAPIVIGNGAWIGLNAVVLKGVTIGDGAVVGAGAVVTRDVPAGCLVGGVPARILRRDVVIEPTHE